MNRRGMKRLGCGVLLLTTFLLASTFAAEMPRVTHLSLVAEGLFDPVRVATDADGNGYVTEPRRGRVTVLDPHGNVLRYLAGFGAPLGVAVDEEGRLYVGDRETGRVAILSSEGEPLGALGSGDGEFSMPSDIAVDSDGRVYVVDSKANVVKVFDETGAFLFEFGRDRLTFPTGIAIDEENGTVLVGQYGAVENGENAAGVIVFDREGGWLRRIGRFGSEEGEFTRIQGIAVDEEGRLYVTDCFQSRIQVIDRDGSHLAFIGEYGTGPGQFRLPSDVAFDGYNRLWVTSTYNGRVEIFGVDDYRSPAGASSEMFTLRLAAGLNLISVPLRPSEAWRLSDLAEYLGPETRAIVTYDTAGDRFLTYLPGRSAGGDVRVTGSDAYLVLMATAKEVTFRGTAWEGQLTLSRGLNLFGMPRRPSNDWRLSDLAEAIGPSLVHFIGYDRATDRFQAYLPDDPATRAVTLEGGVGYFAILSAPKTLFLEGDAWTNAPSAVGVPASRVVDRQRVPLLTVRGAAVNLETERRPIGVEIEIENETTGLVQRAKTGSDGQFAATFVDLGGSRAARVGDVLRVRVVGSGWLDRPLTYRLTSEEIAAYAVQLPPLALDTRPSRTVLLPNYPNPFNPETWIPFRLRDDAEVTIEIYDIAGKRIRTLALGWMPAGNYVRRARAARWDGRNELGEPVPSGVYFVTVRAGTYEATRRLLLSK